MFWSDLSCWLVAAYEISTFENFDLFARTIIRALLEFAYRDNSIKRRPQISTASKWSKIWITAALEQAPHPGYSIFPFWSIIINKNQGNVWIICSELFYVRWMKQVPPSQPLFLLPLKVVVTLFSQSSKKSRLTHAPPMTHSSRYQQRPTACSSYSVASLL